MRLTGRTLLLLVCLVALGARPAAATELLPDLVADPPAAGSLSVDDATGQPALLLRFDGYVHNAGLGALDIRASRSSTAQAMLPKQRIFDSGGSFTDQASPADLVFSNADGHNHWHLQDIARYSLWNGARTAEAAPAQKVGFCLMDSEHVDLDRGPSSPVYADNVPPYRNFCQQGRPDALTLFEGVSAGWRDLYDAGLAFQWVDASSVLPGEYWLREDIDPLNRIRESDETNVPSWAGAATTIPGYNAKPTAAATPVDTAADVPLPVETWGTTSGALQRTIVTQPAHGTLGAISGGKVTYTPEPGWEGIDSFTFLARDGGSAYPTAPAVATATVRVGDGGAEPAVFISGAPASMVAGTSVQLSATVEQDVPGVSWSADAGTIDANGLYVAPATPPAGGVATIIARSASGATATRTIAIVPAPAREPRPEPQPPDDPTQPPPGGGTTNPQPPTTPTTPTTPTRGTTTTRPGLSGFGLLRLGQRLTVTVKPTVAGRLRVKISARGRVLRECVVRAAAKRTVACRVTLPRAVGSRTAIGVSAGLRAGTKLVRRTRRAAPIAPTILRRKTHATAAGATFQLWCALPPGS